MTSLIIHDINHPWLVITIISLLAAVIIANATMRRRKIQAAGTGENQESAEPLVGSQPEISVSDPYVLEIKNTRSMSVTARIFGWNAFWNQPNMGSDPGIEITNLQGHEEINYAFLFAQSALKPFKIGMLRITGTKDFYDHPSEFICQGPSRDSRIMTIHHADGDSQKYTTPILISRHYDVYQEQKFIIDIRKIISIDGGSHLSYELKPFEKIVICIWPAEIFSPLAALNGRGIVYSKAAPQIPCKISMKPNEKDNSK